MTVRLKTVAMVGTLAPKKRLFLNVPCSCLLGTLRGKKR
jgi:hypothetical protein